MNATDREQQALGFMAWHSKPAHAGCLLADDFAWWAIGKDFTTADYVRTWRLVHAEAVARGEVVYTELDGAA